MIKVVAFDLDGTLIDFSIKEFIKAYLKSLYKYLCGHSELAIDEKTFGYGLLQSMEDILKINNESSAYDKFYQALENYFPFDKELMKRLVSEYYQSDFNSLKDLVVGNPYLKKVIEYLKEKNIKMIVATNPLFPHEGILARMQWGDINSKDFLFVTFGEDFHYIKPDLNYYREIISRLKIQPEELLMVGNDVDEDMCASELGCQTYLVTDCLLSRHGNEKNVINKGTSHELYDYIRRVFK